MSRNRSLFFKSLMLFAVLYTPHAFAQSPSSNLLWTGDLRYRFDHREYEQENPERKSIERLRLRLGFIQNIQESSQIEVRLASGPGRTTTNQTLGANAESGSNYEIRIDRASMSFNLSDESKIVFGRMANPFFLVGGNDMAWDTDLNFDGLAFKFSTNAANVKTDLTLTHLLLKEGTATLSPVGVHTAQLASHFALESQRRFSVSLSYLQYDGVKDHVGLAAPNKLFGNSGVACGSDLCYSEAFRIGEFGVEYALPVAEKSLTFFADYQENLAAASNKRASIFGIKWNKLKDPGDVSFIYDYRRVEKDSTLGAYTDAESFNGGTNGEGHRLTVAYQVQPHVSISSTAFLGQSFIAENENSLSRRRFQLDLVATF